MSPDKTLTREFVKYIRVDDNFRLALTFLKKTWSGCNFILMLFLL